MTVPERVAAFLREHKGRRFCDDCIAKTLDLARRQQAQQATAGLGQTAQFRRIDAPCSDCGNSKRTIEAI